MLYESYILPLTILSTLPSAGVGALLMLMLAGLRSVGDRDDRHHPADRHRQEERHHDGGLRHQRRAPRRHAPLEAIRQACLLRFRPILMTTMAALLTGLPLMLRAGAGSEFRKPLGFAMVGGLLLSQVLTLYTTPVIYLYLDRLQHWLAPQATPDASARLQDGAARGVICVVGPPDNDAASPGRSIQGSI